jgi:hypothetical protein
VKKDTGASNVPLAFDANSEDGQFKKIYIPRTLETLAERDNCNAVFKLLAYDKTSSNYVVWDELRASLENALGGKYLESKLKFNSTTGDLEAIFYQSDIEALRTQFITGNDNEASIKFKVIGTVPGSVVMGPEVADANKVVAEFKIILIDNTVVETCADNVLSKAGKTYLDGTQRENLIEYQVPKKDEADLVLDIPAL